MTLVLLWEPIRIVLFRAESKRKCRQAAFAIFCAFAGVSSQGCSTNAVIQSASLELLIEAAVRAGPNLISHFELGDLPDGKFIEVQVAGEDGIKCCGTASSMGCAVTFRNPTGCVLKISSLPSCVQGVSFMRGGFDLHDMGECTNVRWLLADCADLGRDLQGLCKCFPSVVAMALHGFRIKEFDTDLGPLLHMRALKRMELSCVVDKVLTGGDLIQRLLTGLPRLEQLEVQASCNLGSEGDRIHGSSKRRCFELSDSLDNGDGVVVLPAWGDCKDVTVRMCSPVIRFVQLRRPPGSGTDANVKLRSLKIDTLNVVPFGEAGVADDAQLSYHIRIDKVRQAKRDTTGEMKGVHSDKKSTVR